MDDFIPIYKKLTQEQIKRKLELAENLLSSCTACPRRCKVNRTKNEIGFCRIGRYVKVSSAFAHFGEERVLVGINGSGTIFFAGCNLKCVFCQNYDISQLDEGREVSEEELARIMISLQDTGVHNINLVSPSHVGAQIIKSIIIAIDMGLNLPIVYNTNAYDSVEILKLFDGLIDIYMPDFKLWSEELSERYLGAKDYSAVARKAIAEMHRQVGELKISPLGIATRGVLVRHLVMPGLIEESKCIVEWLAKEISKDTYINIMGQYYPSNKVGRYDKNGKVMFAEINRRITSEELQTVYEHARKVGLYRFDK